MFAERLKMIRIEKNLKQADLATLLNITSSAIGMYEQGRRNPDPETVISLARFFDVSTDWLLGVSDIRNPYNLTALPATTDRKLDLTGLPQEDIDKVVEYIELLKKKYED